MNNEYCYKHFKEQIINFFNLKNRDIKCLLLLITDIINKFKN